MDNVNYTHIYAKLTKGISPKIKTIFDRRFGIKSGQPETLESIGRSFKITRERVRQIEEAGFNFIKKNHQETLDAVFSDFNSYFEKNGGLKREDLVLEELGGRRGKPQVLFLLTLGSQFSKMSEKGDYHYFWSTMPEAAGKVKNMMNLLVSDFKLHGKPLAKQDLFARFVPKYNISNEALSSLLEVSKTVQQNKEGQFGLADWPEINPKSVKDKALLIFRKYRKPLHFREITSLIDRLELNDSERKTHPQTVHNELIKDGRFVLVGRGTYALGEWGYVPGTIKDIIAKVLKEKPQLVSQEEIVKEVLTQRLVAKNTVLINLNNKKYFEKDSMGKYLVRETA